MSELTACILVGLLIIGFVIGLMLLIGWLVTPYVVNDIVGTVRALERIQKEEAQRLIQHIQVRKAISDLTIDLSGKYPWGVDNGVLLRELKTKFPELFEKERE